MGKRKKVTIILKTIMFYTRPQRKYGNVPQTYNGYSYDSKREATKAFELDALKTTGEILDWERQVKIDLYGENGTRVCSYKVDFVIHHVGGLIEYLEIKAPITATPVWKLKWKLLEDKLGKDARYKMTVEY